MKRRRPHHAVRPRTSQSQTRTSRGWRGRGHRPRPHAPSPPSAPCDVSDSAASRRRAAKAGAAKSSHGRSTTTAPPCPRPPRGASFGDRSGPAAPRRRRPSQTRLPSRPSPRWRFEVYLSLPAWDHGPLAPELSEAAADLANHIGAPVFGGNILSVGRRRRRNRRCCPRTCSRRRAVPGRRRHRTHPPGDRVRPHARRQEA